MPPAAFSPLSENAGLAFSGEPEWAPAVLALRQLQALRRSANPSGRPNADVLRGFLGRAADRFRERWQIDFPPHLTVQEADLYQEPFDLLKRRCGHATEGAWWVNPRANPELRTSLAKLDRFLVTAVAADRPDWTWVESGWLPDESLLAVARDDDFVAGVLQSRLFAAWWREHRRSHNPAKVVESFPFPWPPRTPVGSLNGPQRELRSLVARAARARDAAQLDDVVAAAYGWPPDLAGEDAQSRLAQHHSRRAGAL